MQTKSHYTSMDNFRLYSQELEGYTPTFYTLYSQEITTTNIPQEDWTKYQAVRYFDIPSYLIFNLYMNYLCSFGSTLDKLIQEGQGQLSATQYEELIPDYIRQLLDLAYAAGSNTPEHAKKTIARYLSSYEDTKTLAEDAGIEL